LRGAPKARGPKSAGPQKRGAPKARGPKSAGPQKREAPKVRGPKPWPTWPMRKFVTESTTFREF